MTASSLSDDDPPILALLIAPLFAATKPHLIFVMADDIGWGETGYCGQPVLTHG